MRKFKSFNSFIFFSVVLAAYTETTAQRSDSKLNADEMAVTIDSISSKLENNYIFPEVAGQMGKSIKKNLKNGKYNLLTDPSQFAQQLTNDLQMVSKDKHLQVHYNPLMIAVEQNTVTDQDNDKREALRAMEMKRENFGFKEIKLLEGNVGYLDLRAFMEPRYAGETAVAAMNFLSNSDALIVDLRQNGGGSPAMVQLVTSYFYTSEPVHLNNFYFRPTNEHTQTWTLPYVPGLRRPDIELFILTSSYTFSAAEEFCYNLKNLERATLIGETTGGGAHPGGPVIATDKFFVRVPKGRAINPITKTNWEGKGVKPHFEIDSEQALMAAHVKALEKLHASNNDSSKVFFFIGNLKE